MISSNPPDQLPIHDHPAAAAWAALNPSAAPPASMETIKEGSVYRLLDAVEGSSVIAKWGHGTRGEAERRMYEDILPRLPSAAPAFYGASRDSDGGWVFTREVTGSAFRQEDPDHRRAVARWLGALHVGIAEKPAQLPCRRESYYHKLLHDQRRFLRTHAARSGASRHERAVVSSLLAEADRLFSNWETLAETCHAGPEALVHGDLVAHNVFLKPANGSFEVVVIDWENSGWGTPAEDLSCVDLSAYHEYVRNRLPQPSLKFIRRLARVGRFFRCLVFLDWVLRRLESDHSAAVGSDLELCTSWLKDLRVMTE